jgi:branched-chain amino acid transport system permease protein
MIIVQVLIGALMIGSIYGLLALGYSLIYKASGLMTFVQGELLMIGSFLGLTFYKYLQLSFFISFLLTMICMFILGMLIEKSIIRVLVQKGSGGIYVVLSTIALSIIFQNLAMLIWGSVPLQFPPIFKVSLINIGGINIAPESLLVLATSIICMVALHLYIKMTKFGTAMRAAAQDPLAASSIGINVSLTTGVTWGLSSALAGVAGVLIGPLFGVMATMGSMVGLKGFAGAVVGGYGDMYGAIIGSLSIGIIETFSASYISSVYKEFLVFFIMILVMIFKPTGIFNAKVYDE